MDHHCNSTLLGDLKGMDVLFGDRSSMSVVRMHTTGGIYARSRPQLNVPITKYTLYYVSFSYSALSLYLVELDLEMGESL